jgi:hypothetical protein
MKDGCRKLIYFELFGENCIKIVLQADFSSELLIIKVFEIAR